MISEYFTINNPVSLALGVCILIFAVGYSALSFVFKEQKGVVIIASLIVSIIATWKLYNERFYGWEGSLITVLALVVLVLILRIFLSFLKGSRSNFR